MRWIKAGLFYFALVFGAGFLLGIVRQLILIPRMGVMWAELLEMPFMFVAIVLATRWVVGRMSVPAKAGPRLTIGLTALSLLVAAELGLVLRLRGLTLAEYIESREPVSGTVYLLMLGVFAAMPWLVAKWSKSRVKTTESEVPQAI